ANERLELREPRGLAEERVESGTRGAAAVRFVVVTGDRDEHELLAVAHLEPSSELEAIEIRQREIEERDIRRELLGQSQRAGRVVGGIRDVPLDRERIREQMRGVGLVVDDQDTPLGAITGCVAHKRPLVYALADALARGNSCRQSDENPRRARALATARIRS